MLRLIIIALLVYGAYYVVSSIVGHYREIERRGGNQVEVAPGNSAPAPVTRELTGLPPNLQPSLDAVQAQGPAAFKRWLDANRKQIRDPKLGDIELDYALAVMRQNSAEAREIYKYVKGRTPANSPLQPRLKSLSKTFE